MGNTRLYASTQLIAALPPIALKVLIYILSWQTQPEIRIYTNRLSKILHITHEDVEVAVQTLIDVDLLAVDYQGSYFIVRFIPSAFDKFFKSDLKLIAESDGIPLATEITWCKQEEEKPQQKDISDMTSSELKTLLLRIQAQMQEHEEVKKKVVSLKDDEVNDLPW